jgi:hypothetical protein
MRIHNIVYGSRYNGFPLHPCLKGHHSEILDKIVTLLDHMCANHNKVFFMRMDVRFPAESAYSPFNTVFERFVNYFVWRLLQDYGEVCCMWSREQKSDDRHQHYHLIILMDGNKTQSIYGHMALAESLWDRYLDVTSPSGLIDRCDREILGYRPNGFQIRRGANDYQSAYEEAFRWASYLAKVDGKGLAPINEREFASSKIPSLQTVIA